MKLQSIPMSAKHQQNKKRARQPKNQSARRNHQKQNEVSFNARNKTRREQKEGNLPIPLLFPSPSWTLHETKGRLFKPSLEYPQSINLKTLLLGPDSLHHLELPLNFDRGTEAEAKAGLAICSEAIISCRLCSVLCSG